MIPVFFKDVTEPGRVEDFKWPEPGKHMNAEECRKAVDSAPGDYAVMGIMWSAHFQDACAAFSLENALIAMFDTPDVFDAVIDRITDFYLSANKIFYEAAGKRLDAVLIGNDLGSQAGLMLSPDLTRRHVLRGTKKLVDQAHGYGFKVMHHSCGAVRDIIPDLIKLEVDIIHPIQALARNMEPESLENEFYG